MTAEELQRIQARVAAGESLDAASAGALVAEVQRLQAVLADDQVIRIRPIAPRGEDPTQAWFWTPKWQQMEREADEDIAAGRVKQFDDLESFFADLFQE